MKGNLSGRSRGRHTSGAFTLIELLVVVAIILILAGITLAAMSVIARKAATAQTLKILQQVKTGLGMFYGSYGAYPPSDQCGGVDDTTFNRLANENDRVTWSQCTDFHEKTGLVFYLNYIQPDSERWLSYLDGLPNGQSLWTSNQITSGANQPTVSNKIEWIQDGWGNKLNYQCTAIDDHQGYRLWSCGENRINESGGGDDLGVTSQE